MLADLLHASGLNHSETTILLNLISNGPNLASILAKRTGLKRPTVYAILDSLLNLGLVTKQKKSAATYFSSVPPTVIPRILEKHAERQLDDVKHATSLMTDALKKLPQTTEALLGGFEITTLESADAVYAQLEDALLSGNQCAIYNPQKSFATEEGKRVTLKYLEHTSKTKAYIREIVVSGPLTDWYKSNINNKHHLVKEIPANRKIISDMVFINDSVILSHYDPHRELGIKISHPDFYRSMMEIFEMLWERL